MMGPHSHSWFNVSRFLGILELESPVSVNVDLQEVLVSRKTSLNLLECMIINPPPVNVDSYTGLRKHLIIIITNIIPVRLENGHPAHFLSGQ